MTTPASDIPVVIFCGGQGTRMRGDTLTKKELVEIGGQPILWHVMRIFSAYGFNHFVLPLGYGADQIKRYFLNYEAYSRDFSLWVGDGAEATPHQFHGPAHHATWQIDLIDTGLYTDKAARIAQVAPYLAGERFFVTYGDGVGNVDVRALLAFHLAHGRLATITAVQPRHYQYGTLEADEAGQVINYQQYPPIPYWINGGFMVFERAALDWMGEGDKAALETGVFARLVAEGQLMLYRHGGFWQSMDTLKDAIELEERWRSDQPWKVW